MSQGIGPLHNPVYGAKLEQPTYESVRNPVYGGTLEKDKPFNVQYDALPNPVYGNTLERSEQPTYKSVPNTGGSTLESDEQSTMLYKSIPNPLYGDTLERANQPSYRSVPNPMYGGTEDEQPTIYSEASPQYDYIEQRSSVPPVESRTYDYIKTN